MSGAVPQGGAAVGRIDTLQPLEGLSVRALRRWCDGGAEALAEDLGWALGEAKGERAAQAFDALCRHCLSSCRRPLVRHGGGCPCLGADEAAFAQLVQTATEGEREDATSPPRSCTSRRWRASRCAPRSCHGSSRPRSTDPDAPLTT